MSNSRAPFGLICIYVCTLVIGCGPFTPQSDRSSPVPSMHEQGSAVIVASAPTSKLPMIKYVVDDTEVLRRRLHPNARVFDLPAVPLEYWLEFESDQGEFEKSDVVHTCDDQVVEPARNETETEHARSLVVWKSSSEFNLNVTRRQRLQGDRVATISGCQLIAQLQIPQFDSPMGGPGRETYTSIAIPDEHDQVLTVYSYSGIDRATTKMVRRWTVRVKARHVGRE